MAFYRCVGGGEKVATGSFSWGASGSTTIDLGFKPKYLCLRTGTSNPAISIYNSDISTTKFIYGSSSNTTATQNLPNTSVNRLASIDDTGFTVNKYTADNTGYYFAIG